MKLDVEFKSQTVLRIKESEERCIKCLSVLTDDEIWFKANSNTNSIANLILHLCGNISQYILSSIGGGSDKRNRQAEFEASNGMTAAELKDLLIKTASEACRVIETCTENELLRLRVVQGFSLTGIGIIIHVTEHLSYHTGQIALLTKLIRNQDLAFYAGVDLNVRNE